MLLGGTVALVALHLWIARDVTLPRRGPGDQWGYLGSARFLAGDPHTYVMPFFPYFTYGYSLVLAPLVHFIHDPERLFLAIKVLNAALAASVLPLLYLFARNLLEARRPHALAGAALGSVVPPLIAHPSSILAENLVLPLAIATVLAGWLFLTDRPAWQRLLFAPSMVWLEVTHNRFSGALLVFFAVLAIAARTRLAPPRLAALNAGTALGLLALSHVVRARIVAARWTYGIETPQGPAADALDVVRDAQLFGDAVVEALGQAWYLVVGTLGLAALGLWAVTAHMIGRSSPIAGTRARTVLAALARDPRRLILAFLLGCAGAVFVTSAYFFTRVANGSEGFIAGRHNESFVPMWVAAGTVLLLEARSLGRVRSLALASAGLVLLLSAGLLAGRRGDDLESVYSILNVPAVVHQGHAGAEVIWRASAIALGATALVALVAALGRRPPVLCALAGAWLVWSVGSEVRPDAELEGWEVPEQVARLGIERAAVVQTRHGGMPVHYLYFLPWIKAVPWDGTGDPPEPFVFAELTADLRDRGGRVALVDGPIESLAGGEHLVALWVMPGAEQARLAAEGVLLSAGSPGAPASR